MPLWTDSRDDPDDAQSAERQRFLICTAAAHGSIFALWRSRSARNSVQVG
jgi:hypothetical protein